MGRGFNKIAKMYGGMIFVDNKGNKTEYKYDYHLDEAVKVEDFTPKRRKLSDIAKGLLLKKEYEKGSIKLKGFKLDGTGS